MYDRFHQIAHMTQDKLRNQLLVLVVGSEFEEFPNLGFKTLERTIRVKK